MFHWPIILLANFFLFFFAALIANKPNNTLEVIICFLIAIAVSGFNLGLIYLLSILVK